tara:strand:- start:470 stop:715 length:246 start_codon:yes stop_codon:yes gene_type:complete
MPKKMDHNEYIEKTKNLDGDTLLFIISDCRMALKAFEGCPNASYYLDEIIYCQMELGRRERRVVEGLMISTLNCQPQDCVS